MFDGIKKALDKVETVLGSSEDRSEESARLLAGRMLGMSIPISIPTAMIFEGEQANPSKWDELLLVNLLTMARNVLASVDYKERKGVKVDDLVDTIVDEVDILKRMAPEANQKTTVEFYLPDYTKIGLDFPKAAKRMQDTPNKTWEWEILWKVLVILKKRKKKEQLPFDFKECGWKLEKDRRKCTILTSYPTDLLSQYKFPSLTLVESHTGKIKRRKQWYTKLHLSNDTTKIIPFNKFTITVFGDGVFFLVLNRKLKSVVMMMAERDRWSYITTEGKIKVSISHIKHPKDREALLSLF